MAVVVAVQLGDIWKSLPLPTHQTLGAIHVQSLRLKDHIRIHMSSAKCYSVIPNNEKSSYMFSSASDLVM